MDVFHQRCRWRPARKSSLKVMPVLAVAFLTAQFVLAKVAPREPYPLIVLPGGSSTTKDSELVSVVGYRITAVLKDGNVVPVDHNVLLFGMPQHYRRRVLQRLFETRCEQCDDQAKVWFQRRVESLGIHSTRGLTIQQVSLGQDASASTSRRVLARVTMMWADVNRPGMRVDDAGYPRQ